MPVCVCVCVSVSVCVCLCVCSRRDTALEEEGKVLQKGQAYTSIPVFENRFEAAHLSRMSVTNSGGGRG